MARRNRPIGEDAKRRDRAAQVLDLRIAGYSYRAIAKQLEISERTAYLDVQGELGRLDALNQEKAERARELEARRLDEYTLKLAPGIDSGDPRAVLAAVRCLERRAKLLGLDAPTQVTGPAGGPMTIRIEHQQLAEDAP